MIDVWIERDAQKRVVGLTVSGHANQGPYGEDIVCAAVSALTISSVNGLEAQGVPLSEVSQTEGGVVCRLADHMDASSRLRAEAILETFALGMRQIRAAGNEPYMTIHTRTL